MNSIFVSRKKQQQSSVQIGFFFIACACYFAVIIYACVAAYPVLHSIGAYITDCMGAVGHKIKSCYP